MEFSVAGFLANIVATAVSVVLSAVFARAALDVVDGRPFDFMGAFGRLNLVNVLIAALLVSIIVTIGFILLVIPGLDRAVPHLLHDALRRRRRRRVAREGDRRQREADQQQRRRLRCCSRCSAFWC